MKEKSGGRIAAASSITRVLVTNYTIYSLGYAASLCEELY